MLGRGTRPAQWLADITGSFNKVNCKVLDFARNTPRLGCINDPRIPNKKGAATGELPVKICEACGCYNHPRVSNCISCGNEFTFQVKIVSKAGTDELIRKAATEDLPIIERLNVLNVHYEKHDGKLGKPPTLKVTYMTPALYREWICLEHNGMAGKMARDWWRRRSPLEPPPSIDIALQHLSNLKCPRFIRVHVNKKMPEILGCEF